MKAISHILVLTGIAVLASCAGFNGPKGNNQTRAQFLDEVWVAPEYRGKATHESFSKIYFAPVATGNLKRQGWWASQSAIKQNQLEADARKLALQFQRSLNQAALYDPGLRMTVVNTPGPDTVIVEMAITELTPAKAYWNTAATAAGFVVPGAGLLSVAGSGSIAIEGRARDADTGKVVATFRNRMKDQMALVNINSYTWYGGSEKNLNEVAVKIARVINSERGTVVSKSSPITLISY